MLFIGRYSNLPYVMASSTFHHFLNKKEKTTTMYFVVNFLHANHFFFLYTFHIFLEETVSVFSLDSTLRSDFPHLCIFSFVLLWLLSFLGISSEIHVVTTSFIKYAPGECTRILHALYWWSWTIVEFTFFWAPKFSGMPVFLCGD